MVHSRKQDSNFDRCFLRTPYKNEERERERPDIKLGAFQLRSQNLGDGWALLDQASPFKDVTGIQRIWGHISQREGLLYFH